MNLLLLEFDNIPQLRNILSIIFSEQLMNIVIDFVMNTESFANFGISALLGMRGGGLGLRADHRAPLRRPREGCHRWPLHAAVR